MTTTAAFVGKTVEEASTLAGNLNWKTRVVSEDGQSFAVTADYCIDRVNFHVEDGIVTQASRG